MSFCPTSNDKVNVNPNITEKFKQLGALNIQKLVEDKKLYLSTSKNNPENLNPIVNSKKFWSKTFKKNYIYSG
jgi:hypothetical protein